MLSAVVGAAAGRSYAELARQLVIEQLGLTATTVGSPAPRRRAASGYRDGEPVKPWDLSSVPGTGDVWCEQAADLVVFVRALHTGRLLTAPAQTLLYEVRAPHEETGSARVQARAYAAGHFIGTVDGRPAHLHPGDNPGYQSLAVWLPDASKAAVVLTNDEACDVAQVLAEVVKGNRP